jgi:hypothetical protein
MANYTTTTFTATETIGDSIFNNNMITEASINIMPDQGYVVTASDFSVPTLPSEISTVVFTDTKVAGQPGNEVKVTATFASTFVVGKRNKINLNFSGEAKKWDPIATTFVDASIVLIDDKNNNKNCNFTTTVESDYAVNTVTDVGINEKLDVIKNTITGTVVRGESTKLATLLITADDDYYFTEKPYLRFHDNSYRNIKLRLSSTNRDSNNRTIGYTYSLLYKNSYNIDVGNPLEYSIIYNAVTIPTVVTTPEVKDITCRGALTENGGKKDIRIYGDINAEFDITITKGTDPTVSILSNAHSVLNPNAPNRRLYNTVNVPTAFGTVKGITRKIKAAGRKKAGLSYCTITQEFPAYNDLIRTTTNSGTINSAGVTNFASAADIKKGDRLFMDAIPTNFVVKIIQDQDDTGVSGRVELDSWPSGVSVSGGATAKFHRPESYDINIYPKAGTVLGSRIPLQIPHKTIKQYRQPALKFTATSANGHLTAPANVTINGIANTWTRELKDGLTVTAASGTTVITEYNAGKNRGRKDFFRVTYTVASTHAVTKIKDPVWSYKNEYDSRGALTSTTDWTNSITSENGGTIIKIGSVESVITTGPHVYTLSFNVLIKKFGAEDTTFVLDLDNLISTS